MNADEPFESLSGQCLSGRYSLERLVARGGSGVVYRGTHLALGCPVAVKVLIVAEHERHLSSQRFVDAFEREARTVAALHHPAVVRVFDSGITEVAGHPHPFVVFEWIEGETLEAHLRDRPGRRRSPREALTLLRPVLEAMACAHDAGVVHRDLKPSNVMVVPPERGGSTARVLDFGVAKLRTRDEALSDASERTTDEFSSFTLSHAAPEQVGRLRTGTWTDVHALSLLLVELLVGERAYRGATTVDLFARITSTERPTPRTFGLDLGPWEPELARALALDPRARHVDAGALLSALESGLDDAQRAWEHPGPPDALPAPGPRRRTAALSVFALGACLAVAAWRLAPGPSVRFAAPRAVASSLPAERPAARPVDAEPNAAAVVPAPMPTHPLAPALAPAPPAQGRISVRAARRPVASRPISPSADDREFAIE